MQEQHFKVIQKLMEFQLSNIDQIIRKYLDVFSLQNSPETTISHRFHKKEMSRGGMPPDSS
jgi:hypothetical protein